MFAGVFGVVFAVVFAVFGVVCSLRRMAAQLLFVVHPSENLFLACRLGFTHFLCNLSISKVLSKVTANV